MGLLVDAPKGYKIGDNVANILKIIHYEPPIKMSGGACCVRKQKPLTKWVKLLNVFRKLFGIPIPGRWKDNLPSNIECPDYDVDSLRKHKYTLEEGEPVWITEKIHGTNARFFSYKDKMYCGSHHEWYKESEGCLWWKILKVCPAIEKFCKACPGFVIYGEIYNVQKKYNYGLTPGQIDIVFYDIRDGNDKHKWLEPEDALKLAKVWDLPWVPVLNKNFVFDFANLVETTDALKSQMPGTDHIAEGIVIKPIKERIHRSLGRVQLKLVSNNYLAKSEDEPFENMIPELNKV
jgi:RNA ligase (TIGR02306 family)